MYKLKSDKTFKNNFLKIYENKYTIFLAIFIFDIQHEGRPNLMCF